MTVRSAVPSVPGPARRPPDIERLSGPGIRAFFKIAELWQLSGAEQQALLGGVSRSTLQRWKRDQDATLSIDQLGRISYLLGIYKNLQVLLPSTGDGWVKRPNSEPRFGGQTALAVMLADGMGGLHFVRTYLDAQVGGWA